MALLVFIVCAIGGIIGLSTALCREEVRAAAIILAPLMAWLFLLILGAIESLMTGSIVRGVGGVLMISIGYWLFIAWAVALVCFLGQLVRRRAR